MTSNVDQDEAAPYKPSDPDLHCLQTYLSSVLCFHMQSFRLLFYLTAAGISDVWRPYNVSSYLVTCGGRTTSPRT